MKNKVILISVDGMRPDGMRECGNPYVSELERICAYTYNGSSVKPSVTFPCHYSMAHSVTPQRHGILTNTYVPPVRPVKGIFEKIKEAGGKTAMFYGWELIRDIVTPGALKFVTHINSYIVESSDTYLTDECIRTIDRFKPDFVFLYLIDTDEKGGHDNGWMTDEYKRRVSVAIDNVKRIIEKYGDEYRVIIMADHGGHDRMHGSDLPEDMIIPFFFYGPEFTPGEIKESVSLLEIAPTIAKLFGIEPEKEWEGHSII
ncbi:MAG: alkaline phosphatase family protein [Clostridia bacterium]|nr:alkaline phosphatase family protein [Clostridia bacterium]